MKKALTIVVAVFWLAVLTGLDYHAQSGDGRKETPELEAVAKMAEADGEADKVPVKVGELLGLANKEPIPAKAFKRLLEEANRSAGTFSYNDKVWVYLVAKTKVDTSENKYEVYVTQPDGVLRGALLARTGKGWSVVPLAEAAERFAAEKAFWKEYVSKASKP